MIRAREAVRLFRQAVAEHGVRELGFGLSMAPAGHPESEGFSWALLLEEEDGAGLEVGLAWAWEEANEPDDPEFRDLVLRMRSSPLRPVQARRSGPAITRPRTRGRDR